MLLLAIFDSLPCMLAHKKKVLLGMSGGVDSSVSGVLLLQAGYEVVGAFMKNWSDCQWREDRRDAMRVAAKLGIEFHTLDFEAQYREKVVKNLFEEYAAGRTPNPDVLCNKHVKFDLFVRTADELGCEFVATGHYAKTVASGSDGAIVAEILNRSLPERPKPFGRAGLSKFDPDRKQSLEPDECVPTRRDGFPLLTIPKDTNKDQTYFLWAMSREVLGRVIFPLGDLTKPEVREIARAQELSVAEKKDSVGICFVGEVDIVEFLKMKIPVKPGPVMTTDGRKVGEHEGLAFFTIGQRHGIGTIGGGPPYYVVHKEAETNTLVVGTEVDPALFSNELTAKDVNWLIGLQALGGVAVTAEILNRLRSQNLTATASSPLEVPSKAVPERFPCLARIRYRQDLQKAQVEILEDRRIHVVFDEHQRAVTHGQSVVLYSEGGIVLGGGIIE